MNILINGKVAPNPHVTRAFISVHSTNNDGIQCVSISVGSLQTEEIFITPDDAALLATFLFTLANKIHSNEREV